MDSLAPRRRHTRLETAPVLGGRYRLGRLLGEGGMGRVYEASHARLANLSFAVKMLRPGVASDSDAFMRLQREAEIVSALRHPNIIRVVDFDVDDRGQAYIVMELLRGESLADRLARGPMSLPDAADVVEQLTGALVAAHHAGVVHRDLKPENVFLCRCSDDHLQVKVLDFGISKAAGAKRLTDSHAVMGTPYYMAPEQAQGEQDRIGPTTDVFALGALVYEMLTGRLAFEAPSIPAVLYRVVHEEPAPAHETGLVSEDVSAAIHRAMAKSPADRFASAAAMRDVLLPLMRSGNAATLTERTAVSGWRPSLGWTVATLILIVTALVTVTRDAPNEPRPLPYAASVSVSVEPAPAVPEVSAAPSLPLEIAMDLPVQLPAMTIDVRMPPDEPSPRRTTRDTRRRPVRQAPVDESRPEPPSPEPVTRETVEIRLGEVSRLLARADLPHERRQRVSRLVKQTHEAYFAGELEVASRRLDRLLAELVP